MTRKRVALLFLVAILTGIVVALITFAAACVFLAEDRAHTAAQIANEDESFKVVDEPYRWVFNYNEDMQLPELPTGCEATAASTIARMQGFYVTKVQVADAMRKSDSDFVNAFIGDPHSEHGWATSAPCVTTTLNGFFELEEKFAAINLTGTEFNELPLPAAVWVTMDMEHPGKPQRQQDGYSLFYNTHCVVVTRLGEVAVDVIDPLRGDVQYPTEQFISVYNAMGKQAVYVDDLTTILKMQRGEYIER